MAAKPATCQQDSVCSALSRIIPVGKASQLPAWADAHQAHQALLVILFLRHQQTGPPAGHTMPATHEP